MMDFTFSEPNKDSVTLLKHLMFIWFKEGKLNLNHTFIDKVALDPLV